MNRFFDILTIQKGFAKIFTEFLTALLQIVFGLLLLAFYHPFFIFFSILLIAVLAGVVYLLGPRGLKTSIYESKYKYKVAQWLEEIARALPTFKLAGTTNLAIEKMDELVTVYLKKRKAHFNVLVYQYLAIVIFKTLIVGGLLILGAYLVVERQITLGQFVASKLVLLLVMSSVEKVILTFDVVYDVLTAADKVGHVTDLPLDQNRGLTLDQRNPKGIGLTIRHLSYKYADGQGKVLNGIDLDVRPGERVAVIGSSGAGKTTFMNVVSGLYCDYEGVIAADSFSLRDLNLNAYRNQLGLNCTAEDVFDGTLLDNLTLGRKTITTSQLVKAVEVALLQDFLHSLPEGLNTRIVAGGQQLPTHIAKKIVLARNLLSDARMLLFDDFFTQLEEGEKNKLVRSLFSHDNGYREWTIVSVSNDPYVLSYCDRIVALDKGKVYKVGTLEDMLQDDFCRDLIPLPIASS
jgi:ABC-type bacteriocin/lantibiotic exporter with double-glycine peptidase domain